MQEIAIGIQASANPVHLRDTLEWLASSTTVPFALRVFGGDTGDGPFGMGACLNRLARECRASFYVMLQSGALPGPHWLETLQEVFRRVPSCGIAGPSTNGTTHHNANRQAIFPHWGHDVATNAMAAKLRFGSAYHSLDRNRYLMDFCVALRDEALQAIGDAPDTSDWLTEMTLRGKCEGFAALWACGAYVHRTRPESSAVGTHATPYRQKPGLCTTQRPPCEKRPPDSAVSKGQGPSTMDQTAASDLPSCETVENRAPNRPEFPLISCIMPTFNRRAFLPRALRCFLSQDYPNMELIVVDDGTDSIADILPPDPRIRYYRLAGKQNVGAKRNFACEQARGEFVVHWDDDEWYGPSRVRRQIEALHNSKARVSGTSVAFFYNEESDLAYRYSYGGTGANWMGALAYPRSVWKERPFDCVPIAEDVRFIARIPASLRMDMKDPTLYVASIHATNTSPKITSGTYWKPEPLETIRVIPGFHPAREFASGTSPGAPATSPGRGI